MQCLIRERERSRRMEDCGRGLCGSTSKQTLDELCVLTDGFRL